MDKNTVIGLVLIGLILSVFTIINQPSEEEVKAQEEKAKIELLQKKEKEKEANKEQTSDVSETIDAEENDDSILSSNWTIKLDEEGNPVPADSGMVVYYDSVSEKDTIIAQPIIETQTTTSTAAVVEDNLIVLENEKLIVTFNAKGGQIAAVNLKEFQSFDDYAKKEGTINPLELFRNGDASNGLSFPMDGGVMNTANELFTVKSQTKDKIVFQLKKNGKQTIEFSYTLKKDAYDLDYDINIKGFAGKVSPQNVLLNWDVAYRKTERLFSEQRRVSTVCFNYKNEGFSYLSEMGDDDEAAEDDIEWVGYKQSYFSSFLKPSNSFSKSGSTFKVENYGDTDAKDTTHLKDYSSTLNLNLNNVDNETVHLNWFFGPNDYKVLKSYESGYDDVLNYGWGLFRWINLYAVQPIFNLLKSTGMGMGIVILLLTFIIKFALMPVQWKMYVSSAKMRILKPELDELSKKYPDKSDAMKKQQETMAMYRESGASPLSGCVPMLIQMPILLAVFRFFPSTFSLRQESFLWAEDLSSYDSIYNFGFDIWMYGDHISLFTLLMAATTLVYTHVNSSNMQQQSQPGMPNMKIIMYFFPIMMIFFFNNYSSGLSYYYFISTLTSIIIMVLIKKFFVDEEKLKLKMANRKANAAANVSKKGPKAKSKFQMRLEEMQKKQQEQQKNRKK